MLQLLVKNIFKKNNNKIKTVYINYIVKYYYNLNINFSILNILNIIYSVMVKLYFSASLLQSWVSHDPSESFCCFGAQESFLLLSLLKWDVKCNIVLNI